MGWRGQGLPDLLPGQQCHSDTRGFTKSAQGPRGACCLGLPVPCPLPHWEGGLGLTLTPTHTSVSRDPSSRLRQPPTLPLSQLQPARVGTGHLGPTLPPTLHGPAFFPPEAAPVPMRAEAVAFQRSLGCSEIGGPTPSSIRRPPPHTPREIKGQDLCTLGLGPSTSPACWSNGDPKGLQPGQK